MYGREMVFVGGVLEVRGGSGNAVVMTSAVVPLVVGNRSVGHRHNSPIGCNT